jgi:integrase/recombinase XerD
MQPVFPVICQPHTGNPMYQSSFRDALEGLRVKAGIEKRVHAHCLRHVYASSMAREGFPINIISKCLGHSSSAVTARYVDHLAPEDAIAASQSRSWPDAVPMHVLAVAA